MGQVQRLEEHVDLLGELIARAEVDLQVRVLEGRLGAERAGILILPELAQIFLTVIERDARLEAVLVVEGDEVGRIGEAGHREAAGRDVLRIERLVGLDEGGVGVEAEAAVSETLPIGRAWCWERVCLTVLY